MSNAPTSEDFELFIGLGKHLSEHIFSLQSEFRHNELNRHGVYANFLKVKDWKGYFLTPGFRLSKKIVTLLFAILLSKYVGIAVNTSYTHCPRPSHETKYLTHAVMCSVNL